MAEWVVSAQGIRKRYGGVEALRGVDFYLERGKVHALMGENGAGKSTLMKILLGYCQPDAGTIKVGGQQVQLRRTADALAQGIAMIYQELHPVRHMSIADNIFLGREPRNRFKTLDYPSMYQRTAALLQVVGLDLPPQQSMNQLSVAQWQLVEIAKALRQQSRVLIMDEPTSALSEREVKHLFDLIAQLNAQGVSIIYISHKLAEVYAICEDVTVLRDGYLIATGKLKYIPQAELISMMVGQGIKQLFPKQEVAKGEVLLEVQHLCRKGEFEEVSFSLHRGEILGITGLVGAGRTEMVETLYGLRRADRGQVRWKGQKVKIRSPKEAIALGIVMVPEDRKVCGLVLSQSTSDNIVLAALQKCCRFFFLSRSAEKKAVASMVAKLQVKTPNPSLPVNTLSGGNQQKVVVAKALFCEPELIILDEPTRGIDVKTKAEIHALMSRLAGQGKAVLMVSSEIPEILGMSDRILIMAHGRIVKEAARGERDHGEVLELAMQEGVQ